MLSKSNVINKDDTKVMSRFRMSDTVWLMNWRKVEYKELLRKTNEKKLNFGTITKGIG